ncbi:MULTISPECIES: tRNA (guanosine(37)-N1)-methyltransferase TrmD [Thalassospira]|jgi:tRNA (guanine37-N1)-methyltransferase|uniref:tRNA (guanine-N(1)-)-methyltransferase n=1 Tax=Thalassospira profundimaris TaxID=502049 RepID=A0A367VCN3_9PROT|nr:MULTISPECIES: tRNA (guanosine(37)-N1)-methyltransferase TrmD [Thalassospira]MBR9901239.1 tRNA (guanosine(37)-N1)-methyltransferase TrmD [Rhodospirillales bacterium]KZB72071.1 tRNA (guanine-N1)-methyltransferase [Thalassospira sp. MCCC 1A01148]MBC45142.1 tRNA (guanosine(37)-N1)-methyltransferase TrmD [Thalassospira sp.]MBO6808105.1 tRNA (guanosine(37)-N1)-methyltransferase TrmD [Thalassospira sp.]MBS8274153.1 tRNA (guanosine(37)-N1)-methyltransferase TrmD [Thalassospira tepidiphila]|tara:strand:+ start:16 stop:732 length:717 start_codon:yes stop_codon:yes gene_type:complete
MSVWQAKVATLFPEMFPGVLGQSLAGKALENGIWSLDVKDIRDHATDRHRTVDDNPFGGGAGMVMRPDIVDAALRELRADAPQLPLIYLSPRGKVLNQKRCRELAAGPGAILLCGRYEGIDQRVLDEHQAEEISIGDYILMGGELPAMVLIESCIRLIEGTVNKTESVDEESFETGLLEYPHYTRPANWNGRDVPEILLSGHHAKVQAWRHAQAEEITRARRPDLWDRYVANGNIKEG